jgi:adenosyl cobinamide kinase/adenosyl cobinamide phosphate guanylyltransferase
VSLTVLLGGARSGKSALAQRWAGEGAILIATGTAVDDEMRERIARHRADRPTSWITVEEPLDLRGALAGARGTVVVDCLSLWVANLFEAGWTDESVEAEGAVVAAAAAPREAQTFAVSNEVGLGIVPATPLGRRYRDVLGRVNASWAEASERAVLVVGGRVLELDRA